MKSLSVESIRLESFVVLLPYIITCGGLHGVYKGTRHKPSLGGREQVQVSSEGSRSDVQLAGQSLVVNKSRVLGKGVCALCVGLPDSINGGMTCWNVGLIVPAWVRSTKLKINQYQQHGRLRTKYLGSAGIFVQLF